MIGMFALGQTIVMLVKEIDLSISSSMAFAPIASISIVKFIKSFYGINVIEGGNYFTSGLAPFIILTIFLGMFIGFINGVLNVKGKVPSIIVTLGMMYTLRGSAYILSGGHPIYLTRLQNFKWLGTSLFLKIPVSFMLFIIISVITIVTLQFTKVGPRIYSTGGNEKQLFIPVLIQVSGK